MESGSVVKLSVGKDNKSLEILAFSHLFFKGVCNFRYEQFKYFTWSTHESDTSFYLSGFFSFNQIATFS